MAKEKHSKKNAKKTNVRIAAAAVLILALAGLLVFIAPQWLYTLGDGADDAGQSGASGTDPGQAISFPVSAADGKLEISSLYPYNGINPDCGNQEGANVAAITVTNLSDGYLSEGSIALTFSDGTTANFKVSGLPAGKTSMVFSVENAALPAEPVCVDVMCEAEFDPEASMSADLVSVSVDGLSVMLTNVSGRELKNIVVYCRNILEPDYFGGITYSYNIEKLAVGASTTVDAVDCILGLAEVVRIDAE